MTIPPVMFTKVPPGRVPRRLVFSAKSNGNWFDLDYRDSMEAIKWMARNVGKRIRVTFEVWSNSMSAMQRRYFFGVLIEMILEEIGELDNEDNRLQLERELSATFNMVPGLLDPEKPSYRTLSQLTTVEAEDFFKNVREWAHVKLNLFLPLPNEYDIGMVFSSAEKKSARTVPDVDAPGDSTESQTEPNA